MRVQRYSDIHFLDLVRIVEKFHKEYLSDRFTPCEPDVIVDTIKEHCENTFLLISQDEKCVGVLAGVKIQSKFNGEIFFQEIIWYVEKPFGRYGFMLIREVEKFLKSTGVSTMIMSVLERSKSDKIKRIYSKLGYKLEETHFMRTL